MIKSKPSEFGSSCAQVLISPFLLSTLWLIFILCVFSLSPLFSERWSSSMDGAAYLQRCLEALPQGCLWIITNHSTNTAWRLVQTSWQWANRQTERRQVRDDFKKKKSRRKWVIQAAPSRLKIRIKDWKAAKKLWKITEEVMEMRFCCFSFDCALDGWELSPLSVGLSNREGANSSQRSSKVSVLRQKKINSTANRSQVTGSEDGRNHEPRQTFRKADFKDNNKKKPQTLLWAKKDK